MFLICILILIGAVAWLFSEPISGIFVLTGTIILFGVLGLIDEFRLNYISKNNTENKIVNQIIIEAEETVEQIYCNCVNCIR